MFSDIILNLFNEGRFQQGKKIIEIGGAVSNYVSNYKLSRWPRYSLIKVERCLDSKMNQFSMNEKDAPSDQISLRNLTNFYIAVIFRAF